MRVFLLLALLAFASSSFAIVDMKSANFSESWVDLTVPGVGYDLKVNRTYNSRAIYSGLFGFGWCSDFETKMEVTPEGNIKLTECGAGMETVFSPKGYDPSSADSTIRTILAEIKKRKPDLKPDYLASLREEMSTNEFMREEFARKLGLSKTQIQEGRVYMANGREAETMVLKEKSFKRSLTDGTYQLFDSQSGRMTHMYDKNGNYLKLVWERDVLQSVVDGAGRKLTFKYDPSTKKVAQITGPNNLVATYVIKNEDLREVVDAKKVKYTYSYDDLHNLEKIAFPDGTFKKLTYNKDKDWVMSFQNRKGCIEKYDYQVDKDDPKNHFWSIVEKRCGDQITNQSKYEFFHRPKSKGPGIYLYRVRSDNNGDVTDIVYHEIFGKPISMLRDNIRTDFTYYDNGLVASKKEPGRVMNYEYKNTCMKVSSVTTRFLEIPKREKRPAQKIADRDTAASDKVLKTIKTVFSYDERKCNLMSAQNSDGQTVKLQYDSRGRIEEIQDQTKKIVKIKYEEKFGKPAVVTRPGLGTIVVSYKSDGEIAKVDSKEGPTVAAQVAGIFNSLLDIIAPATAESPL